MFTKETAVDKIEVVISEGKTVHVREKTKVFEDEVLLTEKYHRYTINPGDDYSSFPDLVRTICDVAFA